MCRKVAEHCLGSPGPSFTPSDYVGCGTRGWILLRLPSAAQGRPSASSALQVGLSHSVRPRLRGKSLRPLPRVQQRFTAFSRRVPELKAFIHIRAAPVQRQPKAAASWTIQASRVLATMLD